MATMKECWNLLAEYVSDNDLQGLEPEELSPEDILCLLVLDLKRKYSSLEV
jgi:hypothetical protein